MRRSSAPSAGANKRPRFAPPFVPGGSSSRSESDRHQDPVTIADAAVPRKRQTTQTETSARDTAAPANLRRPLTEILSLLDGESSQEDGLSAGGSQPEPRLAAASPRGFVTTCSAQQSYPRAAGSPPASVERINAPNRQNENLPAAHLETPQGRYFEVVWCKKSARKHKKWEGDAILEVHNRHVLLWDPDGKMMGQASGYKIQQLKELDDGALLSVGGREVELQNSLSAAEFASRRSGSSSASTPSAAASDPLPQRLPPQPARPFVSPLVGATNRRPAGAPVQPRYDPGAPGALVMPEPSSQFQWRHNSAGRCLVPVVVDPHVSRHLRPHQRAGVAFLYRCVQGMSSEQGRGAVLADEMGLGKTLQCIALVWTLLKQGPFGGEPSLRRVLVVAPSGLVRNWVREFTKWLGRERLSVFAVDQSHPVKDFMSSRGCPVLIISYEMAVRNLELLRDCKFDLMICDEGHRLKNCQIKTVQALSSLDCPRRLLLTGTPVQNDLSELYALVQFVNPGVLGSVGEFRREFERPIVAGRQPEAAEEERAAGERQAAALANITDRFILRRTAEILDKYLPPKVETAVFCRPSPLQVTLYQEALQSSDLQRLLSGESPAGAGGMHLLYISLLKKLCSHPALLLTSDRGEESLPGGVRLNLPERLGGAALSADDSGKMAVLCCLLRQLRHTAPRQKMVLISYYTQTLNLLAELCEQLQLTFLRLDGSTPAKKRQTLVDQFNSPYGKESVFLLSAKAGGVGLNLVGASSVVLFDLDWNPANDLQALARVWRDGQKHLTRVYRLLTAGTIEEKVYQRQLSKQGLGAAVVDSGQQQAGVTFSQEELRDLFSMEEDADCSTHRLLGCRCRMDGEPSPEPAEPEPEPEERPCQLAPGRPGRRVVPARPAEWQHFRGPLDQDGVQDAGLAAAGDRVSFLFRTVVAAAFE